ncbi:MAG: radical SAM protein, partial [Bacteroidetes bacterium]|nr:radical SAM protein [Bacteroidota bacterium]
PGTRKVFLADGNAMVLSHAKLLAITKKLNQQFPKLGRISAYALPSDMRSKTIEELESLRDQKLNFVYVGIESGDDELLRLINKSETAESTIQGLVHARRAGVRLSVMIILGLGGRKYSKQHAIRSAEVLNAIQPEYFSTLVLSYPFGEKHFQSRVDYEHQSLSTKELLQELHLLIDRTQLEGTIFRSDHASNYLSLKGVLGKDKHELLKTIEYALSNPQVLREEWMRGL